MIYALSGPSHSGKTTYLEWIENNFPNAVVFKEIMRDKTDSIDEIRKDAHQYFELQKEIIWSKFEQEKSAFVKNLYHPEYIYVFDRSLCDSVYYLTHYVDVLALNNGDRSKYFQFCFKAYEWMKKACSMHYDRIFLFEPIDASNNKDPMRPKDIAEKQHVEYSAISALTHIACASAGVIGKIKYINAITDTTLEKFYENSANL